MLKWQSEFPISSLHGSAYQLRSGFLSVMGSKFPRNLGAYSQQDGASPPQALSSGAETTTSTPSTVAVLGLAESFDLKFPHGIDSVRPGYSDGCYTYQVELVDTYSRKCFIS